MEQKDIRFQKQRDLSLVISDSFEFLKQEARPLLRMITIYVLPFILLYAGAQIYFQRNVMSNFNLTDPEALKNNIGPFYLNIFIFIGFALFVQSLLVGTFYTYVSAYINKGKGKFQLHEISSGFFINGLYAFGANLVFTFIIIFGMMMCFIPGIYFANTLSLVVFIFIFERKGLGDALGRSWRLVNLNWWNTFLINIIGLVMLATVSIILSIPSIAMGVTTTVFSTEVSNPVDYPIWFWVLNVVSTIITTTLLVIPFTFQAFQYFNLAEKEQTLLNSNQN